MVLALKLPSSFLQLLQTQWIAPRFSADTVHFLLQPTDQKPDVSRPFVSLSFESFSSSGRSSQAPSSKEANVAKVVKEALLELGIMLLEIWHEMTLEERFALPAELTMNQYIRQAWMLEWLDDVNNPPPDLYHKAVSHCVARVTDVRPGLPQWSDMKLWKAVCEGVVEPLSKISNI